MRNKGKNNQIKKGLSFILLGIFFINFLFLGPKETKAQGLDINQFVKNYVLDPAKYLYERGGAQAFQFAVRTALNKIAYDTATWLGSGGQGQKPLFITEDWGTYLGKIGDEAAGQFIEQTVKNWQSSAKLGDMYELDAKGERICEDPGVNANPEDCKSWKMRAPGTATTDRCKELFDKCKLEEGEDCEAKQLACVGYGTSGTGVSTISREVGGTFNVCEPSSIRAKLQISLMLTDFQRPQAPNCSASKLIQNWENEIERYKAMEGDAYLSFFSNLIDPRVNDLGQFIILEQNLIKEKEEKEKNAELELKINEGWLDVRDVAGSLLNMPQESKAQAEMINQGYISNLAIFSGDAVVDAANVFLNRLAISFFDQLKKKMGSSVKQGSVSPGFNNIYADPNIRYGERSVQENFKEILEPRFSTQADYSILSSLAMCQDINNPGPSNCVIDEPFRQAITEKLTVIEAMEKDMLHKDWIFTSSFTEGTYNLRNLSILRKYRIVPASWEEAALKGKNASLMDLVSCFSDSDEFDKYSASFDRRDQSWCRGLVDPHWVLKAPLNTCAKQGFGNFIVNKTFVPKQSADGSMIESLLISRAGEYCADDKSCIKEADNGSCLAYGYCLSEKQTWAFDSKSCEAIDNTCQAFYEPGTNQRIAFLENTIDYGNCTSDSVGCLKYSINGTYDTNTRTVNWSNNPLSTNYFNSWLETCSSRDEGCSQLIRIKPGWGGNLVMGSDMRQDPVGSSLTETNSGKLNDYWPIRSNGELDVEVVDSSQVPESLGKSILVSSSGSYAELYSNINNSLIPANFNIMPGEAYTLSADIYVISGTKASLSLAGESVEINSFDSWEHLSLVRSSFDDPISNIDFSLKVEGQGVSFLFKNIKLEMNAWDSGYLAYDAHSFYQKLIPPYLANACYENAGSGNPDYRLKSDAPSICHNFARQCNASELGCENYTEISSGFSVTAQATTRDYCDASCNGYNIYVARPSFFFSNFSERIIPNNSIKCQASAVGCSEFTNLDKISSMGEAREYYTQLKQCIKPGASCDNFYTWVGSEESGYQLKALVLKKDQNGNPAVTSDDSEFCNEEIFNLPLGDPRFNPDCQQYYNQAGSISYHLSINTITCSEDCHPYRLSENNLDYTLSQEECVGLDKNWNSASSVCNVCKNGGTWDSQHQACIYQAIPNEGIKCQASAVGCREYNGSLGNNIRQVLNNSFEIGLEGWDGRCGDAAVHSQVVNTRNGNSMLYDKGANSTGSVIHTDCDTSSVSLKDKLINSASAARIAHIRRELGHLVQADKSYTIKFTAAAASETTVKIGFMNSKQEISYFNTSESNPEGEFTVRPNFNWQTYELNLLELDHDVDEKESLIIIANDDFYIDNIILNLISDRYYLIKNTSEVPDICYYDILDNYKGADYNLGCSAYYDRPGNVHYLRQFTRLCQDSAAGCELMIDMHNNNDFKARIWGDLNGDGVCGSNEPECISVPADNFIFAIYDKTKLCNQSDKGCFRVGQANSISQNPEYGDVFRLMQPDNYDQALCGSDEAGCEAWSQIDGSVSYFKNPGDDLCVYRSSNDPSISGKAWYEKSLKRCDLNENGRIDLNEYNAPLCESNDDCYGRQACILDNNDRPCEVAYNKTFGLGGQGNQIPVPVNKTALCEISSSGCSEYFDPISHASPNLVKDPARENIAHAWAELGSELRQTLVIEPNKLYIFSDDTRKGTGLSINFPLGVSILQDDNNLSSELFTELSLEKDDQFIYFYSRTNTSATVVVNSSSNSDSIISLKEGIVNYQFTQNIDKTSCNGVFDLSKGCVFFNERSMNGSSGLSTLSGFYNASASEPGKSAVPCSEGDCSANSIIKVSPDRTCATWLDCMTYTIDPETNEKTCYAVGECNRLDDKGNCANFINIKDDERSMYSSVPSSRASAYSVIDQYSIAKMKEVGLNTEAHYNFEISPILECRRNDNPNQECSFEDGIYNGSIVNSSAKSKVDYPAEGHAFLRVKGLEEISPHSKYAPIAVVKGQDYYLNFLLNTASTGLRAKIIIETVNDRMEVQETILEQEFIANNAWERKIVKISKESIGEYKYIRLYLGTNARTHDERYVYFDDINIEPVLEVGENKYLSKECRLYPGQNAESCISRDDKLISNGLFDYCLEHDLANKGVCTLWYPVDEISANYKPASSNLGYYGTTPLNYCTEANGNFSLVKKVEIKMVSKFEYRGGKDISIPGGGTLAHTNDVCLSTFDTKTVERYCGDSENYRLIFTNQKTGFNYPRVRMYCAPKSIEENNKVLVEGDRYRFSEVPNCSLKIPESTWVKYDDHLVQKEATRACPFPMDKCENPCPAEDGCTDINELTNANPPIRIFDYDNPALSEGELKLIYSNNPEEVYTPTCKSFTQLVDSYGNNLAWAERISLLSPYPYNGPPFFDDGVMRYSDTYSSMKCHEAVMGEVEVCAGTCEIKNSYYEQDWESWHEGQVAWFKENPNEHGCIEYYEWHGAGYTEMQECFNDCASPGLDGCYIYETIEEFVKGGEVNCGDEKAYFREMVKSEGAFGLDSYGRNRSNTPFGAATLPVNFDFTSSEKIKFYNQYSDKLGESIFAGRPYDCNSGLGSGCYNYGYCSLNPNMICIYDNTKSSNISFVNQYSCGANNGTCVPLWNPKKLEENRALEKEDKYKYLPENVLKNIFLKSYAGYVFDLTSRKYKLSDDPLYSDQRNPNNITKHNNPVAGSYNNENFKECQGSEGQGHNVFSSFWCWIKPEVSNIEIDGERFDSFRSKHDNTIPAGLHKISFNINISPEQQPLKSIIINWGDGNIQTLINEVNRPGIEKHQVYHFFKDDVSIGPSSGIGIMAVDNWDKYCCTFNGGSSCSIEDYCKGTLAN